MSTYERTRKRIKLQSTVVIDATFENELLFRRILTFIGDCQYRYIAGVNRTFRKTYDLVYTCSIKTTHVNASTMHHMLFCYNEMGIDDRIMLFKSAACYGNLVVLQYLLSEHIIMELSQNYNGIEVVVKHGHLHVLKWLYKNGLKLDWYNLALYAAYCGNLPILKWVHSIGRPKLSTRFCNNAASMGHLHVLKWLRSNVYPWSASTCSDASKHGRLKVLQWLRRNGCEWDQRTCTHAARRGNLEMLQWAFNNGCAWDKHVYIEAGKKGHYEILNWANTNGCPWSEDVCSDAARFGRFEFLRWLHNKGCPWDEKVCAEAARNGHLEILQWARENGCPWDGRELDDESLPSDSAFMDDQ
jgi:hypothetical protein